MLYSGVEAAKLGVDGAGSLACEGPGPSPGPDPGDGEGDELIDEGGSHWGGC